MASDTCSEILAIGTRWTRAEVGADTSALNEIASDEFRLVGPLGFVLDKSQWLDRYASGAFETKSLAWEDVEVREFGDTAVAIGQYVQQAAYQGQPADGRFRATQVFVRVGAEWKLASLHLSPLAQPTRPE